LEVLGISHFMTCFFTSKMQTIYIAKCLNKQNTLLSWSKFFCLWIRFDFKKTITDLHIFAYLNIKSGYELSKIKNLYPRNTFKGIIVHIISVYNKTLHDLTLIKESTARIMFTGCSEINTVTVIQNKRIANLKNSTS
jgi:hypothetical protein